MEVPPLFPYSLFYKSIKQALFQHLDQSKFDVCMCVREKERESSMGWQNILISLDVLRDVSWSQDSQPSISVQNPALCTLQLRRKFVSRLHWRQFIFRFSGGPPAAPSRRTQPTALAIRAIHVRPTDRPRHARSTPKSILQTMRPLLKFRVHQTGS